MTMFVTNESDLTEYRKPHSMRAKPTKKRSSNVVDKIKNSLKMREIS